MSELHVCLCDLHTPVVDAWRAAFAGSPGVEIRLGDLTDVSAEAYVSAANSYGEMGGGVDWALRERFRCGIEDTVREAIGARGGFLPVGRALAVETGDLDVPYLIVAPTMEVPMRVAETNNAYVAFRAALQCALELFREGALQAIAAPGLCTGIGGMDPELAAAQMRRAHDEVLGEQPV